MKQKGITLITLVITIVLLLILAAVAIGAIRNDSLIGHSKNQVSQFNEVYEQDQNYFDEYKNSIKNEFGGPNTSIDDVKDPIPSIDDVKDTIFDKNTTVKDEYGNEIVVPPGFKITDDADDVTEGIVIEDCTDTETKGSQFVWVPVGEIYTNKEQTESKTITLGRYDNFTATNGVYTPATTISGYTEETATSTGLGENGNAIARNINNFITSANKNKGYYIGRYEAGKENNTLVCKAGQIVYRNINQLNASTACKNMYNNGADGYATGTFSSDLLNSYAWDTAIIFIQTFGGKDASDYYLQNASSEIGKFVITTGTIGDEYCNINDMSCNAGEWSTESYNQANMPCVFRGGVYDPVGNGTYLDTARRSCNSLGTAGSYYPYQAFRPILYVA